MNRRSVPPSIGSWFAGIALSLARAKWPWFKASIDPLEIVMKELALALFGTVALDSANRAGT